MTDIFQMDKSAVRIVKIDQQGTDFQYWQTQPAWKRLAALEAIRREYHGYGYDTKERLQRVYTIVKYT